MIARSRHPDQVARRHAALDDEHAWVEAQREMHARHNDEPTHTPVCPGCAYFATGTTTRDENGTLWHSACLGASIAAQIKRESA